MKSLKLVHVGDVHFPDAIAERVADVKDEAFPARIADMMIMRPIQCVMRALQAELDSRTDAIVFSGDFTSGGNIPAYSECLEHFGRVLNLARWDPTRVHAVPGNHDVDRSQISADGSEPFKKFEAFAVAWKRFGVSVLTVEGVRQTEVTDGNCRTALFSLNSCIGCGEKRYLPKIIADKLERLMNDYVSDVGPKIGFDLIGETLDTPAFRQEDIESVCSQIKALDPHVLPLVVSHHNLLPQALLRIELYTELLNAGFVRSRFTRLPRPLLYCHGHIHDTPLEVIQRPANQSARLVCISAPQVSRGFNVIYIDYGSSGYPLGCRVEHFELNLRDCEVASRSSRVPFYGPDYRLIRRFGHELLPRILANLPDDIRLIDLEQNLSSQHASLSIEVLADALLEAEWFGFVELVDKDLPAQYWNVRKLVR